MQRSEKNTREEWFSKCDSQPAAPAAPWNFLTQKFLGFQPNLLNQKVVVEPQKTLNSHSNLEKMNKVGGITVPDIVTEQTWGWGGAGMNNMLLPNGPTLVLQGSTQC